MPNLRPVILAGAFLALFSCVAGVCAEVEAPKLTIDEAVRTALLKNPSVRAAREEAAAASAQVRRARADRLPLVDASIEYRRITAPPTFEIPAPAPGAPPGEVTISLEENTVGAVAARQAVYTGGRVPASISRAEALFDVAAAGLGSAEAQVALQTREAYYGVLLSQSLVRSAEKSLAAAREQLAAATARFEAGAAPRFDVLRAQTQVSQSEQDLTEARNQVEISRVALNRLIGVPLEREFALVEPERAPVPGEDLPSLVEIARCQRAEVLAARARLAAAEAGIRLAESERRPEVGLTASYEAVANETAVQTTGWTFIASATMKIFDAGRTRASIAEAKSLRDAARTDLEETSRAAEQEVREAYVTLQTARQTIETARTRLAQAEEAHGVASVRYEAGVGTAVELADALATLAAARTNLDRAVFDYNVAYARLQRALGRTVY